MSRGLALSAVVAGWTTIFVGSVQAGGIVDCQTPFAYGSAVNVFVLEDASDPQSDDALRDIRRRLTWLVKLDALFSDSYGSLGVLFLGQNPDLSCTLERAIQEFRPHLPPRGAAIFVHQRVYREDQTIFVQTYLEFFRVDEDHNPKAELVSFEVPELGVVLSEELPTQRLAFPPRMLETSDVEVIERAFEAASIVYPRPELGGGGQKIDLSPNEGATTFEVLDSRPDGWINVDSTASENGFRGWLRADPEVKQRLRAWIPELRFIDGLVGYLSFVQNRDASFPGLDDRSETASRADRMLYGYAYAGPRRPGSVMNGPPRDDAGRQASVLAAALRADMSLSKFDQIDLALDALIRNASQSRDSRLRDLVGVARACCVLVSNNPTARAKRLSDIASAVSDFQAALQIDPTNDRAIANLEGAYRLIEADLRGGLPKSSEVRDFARWYYETKLPLIREIARDLDGRIAQIAALRQPDRMRAPDDKLQLAFVVNSALDFWKLAEAGVKKAQAELPNYELQFKYPAQGTAALQNALMDDLVAAGTDAIMISSVDPKTSIDAFNRIAAQVPLFTTDSDAPDSNRIAYLGSSNTDAGVQAGEIAIKALPNGGKCMGFVGFLGADNAKERIAGFKQAVEGKGIELVDVRGDDVDFARARSNVDDVLAANPEINCMVGFYSYNPPKIYEALQAAGKLGAITVIAFDEDPITLGAVRDGSFAGTVVQQPFEWGYQGMKLMAAYLKGDMSVVPENKLIIVPTKVIDRDNVDQFEADLKAAIAG